MTTIAAALTAARQLIEASEVRLLLRHVLGCSAAHLEAHREDALDPSAEIKFNALVNRRLGGEPIAYLIGTREFYGRTFSVAPGVLIPRPETELIVDCVLARYNLRHCEEAQPMTKGNPRGTRQSITSGSPRAFGLPRYARSMPHRDDEKDLIFRILDLGTGSGCLAITLALELPQANVTAIDVSPDALAIARDNAVLLGAEVRFLQSDWFASVANERFDVIVSNPPYIAAGDPHLAQGDLRFEPPDALAAGSDGLDAIRAIIAGAKDHLNPGGLLLLEHGYNQADRIRDLLEVHGFVNIEQHRDLANILRISLGYALQGEL